MVFKKFLKQPQRQTYCFVLFVIIICSGCGVKEDKSIASSDNKKEQTEISIKPIDEPARDKMISDLYLLERKLSNYNVEDAKKLMQTQFEFGEEAESRKEKYANQCAKEHKIGAKRIGELAEYGSYGKLEVISPSWYNELQHEKSKTNLYADDKYWYAMTYKEICVTGYWDGEHFVFSVLRGLQDEIDNT